MIRYRGETFKGYNIPKRTPGKSKKFAVLAKQGNKVKLIRFGDPQMSIKKHIPSRRKSFRARHKCSTAKNKLTARYWSCKMW
jgi:CelD/BcsL family acetyltransferase involved in cellulose biosynthesis